jgi:hypothetical protein
MRTSKQEDSHGKFEAEEELEVGLWRLNVWIEDFLRASSVSACIAYNYTFLFSD